MLSDSELIKRAADKDEVAFDELYRRHHRAVARQVGRLVTDPDAAEDLAQETFLRMWRNCGQWAGSGSVKAWLLRIATNLCLNHLKARNRVRSRVLSQASVEDEGEDLFARIADSMTPSPEAEFEASESLRALRAGIAELPEEKREVINMILSEELPLREISRRLDLPLGTVKSRIHYATRQLQDDLKDHD